ncbi:MAG: guanylate kinase [Chlamydiales bacterium]|nr:guanylate kinase [Chlamydiales bacterium]
MDEIHVKIFVLVGPSGVGKSTLISKLKQWGFPFRGLVSYTTRPRRVGEEEGRDYFFVNQAQYARMEEKKEFILSTQVHGNWYGISKEWLNQELQLGYDVVCSLNIEAAKNLKSILDKRVVTIFIAPPSFDTLQERLIQRSSDGDSTQKIRLVNAQDELKQQDSFNYKIVNRDLLHSVEALKKIVLLETKSKLIVKQLVEPVSDRRAIRAMSYNIRMAPCAEDDDTENAWEYRLPKINMIIERYKPDVIGLQEVSLFQMGSLQNSSFDLPYKMLAKYPSRNPIESGLGIVYNSEKVSLISDLKTIWLNEVQSHSEGLAWDGSAHERYVIYAKFKNLLDDNEFWFMTTHFDHLGQKARQESAKIVIDLAERLNAPVIVTGDFNCFPQQGGAELYQLLSSRSIRIKDSKTIANKVFGVPGSWIGWDYDAYKQRTGYSKYDFIFTHDSIEVIQHGIIDDCVWDDCFQKELYPSDHRPVLSDLKFISEKIC